jgi:hypothetical protein
MHEAWWKNHISCDNGRLNEANLIAFSSERSLGATQKSIFALQIDCWIERAHEKSGNIKTGFSNLHVVLSQLLTSLMLKHENMAVKNNRRKTLQDKSTQLWRPVCEGNNCNLNNCWKDFLAWVSSFAKKKLRIRWKYFLFPWRSFLLCIIMEHSFEL